MPQTKTLKQIVEVAEKRAKVAATDSEKARKKATKDKLRKTSKREVHWRTKLSRGPKEQRKNTSNLPTLS